MSEGGHTVSAADNAHLPLQRAAKEGRVPLRRAAAARRSRPQAPHPPNPTPYTAA